MNAKRDPEWVQLTPHDGRNAWGGHGGFVSYLVVSDDVDVFWVHLHVRGRFLDVPHIFRSLQSAQRWCEKYFG